MNTKLNQSATLWDMGMSELIEETPTLPENRSTQFKVVRDSDTSNVYLMRPEPSWKPLQRKQSY